jgi:hypothetical protein
VTLYVLHAAYTQSIRARKVIPTPNLPVLPLLCHSACSNSRPHTHTDPGHVDLRLSNSNPPVIVCCVVVVVTPLASTAPSVPPPVTNPRTVPLLLIIVIFFFSQHRFHCISFFLRLDHQRKRSANRVLTPLLPARIHTLLSAVVTVQKSTFVVVFLISQPGHHDSGATGGV